MDRSAHGLACLLALAGLGACRDNQAPEQTGGRIAEVAGTLEADSSGARAMRIMEQQPSSAVQSLARAAGGADGLRYTVRRASIDLAVNSGTIVGRISGGERASRDSVVVPTHDLGACAPFTQRLLPSTSDGVGNALVWLVGVASGSADTASRRTPLRLAGCRLEPRVQRVPVGGTIMVTSRDVMMSRLRFSDAGAGSAVRSTVMLNDAGQVVPIAEASAQPGLVMVHDDLHPWVRAWIAVSPHPYVAVTLADGQFRFESVPSGRYTLVVWSEVLGTRTRELQVTNGVETRLELKF